MTVSSRIPAVLAGEGSAFRFRSEERSDLDGASPSQERSCQKERSPDIGPGLVWFRVPKTASGTNRHLRWWV